MEPFGEHLGIEIDHRLDTVAISSSTLNILHLNTRSCRGKLCDLVQMIDDLKYVHVVVFSETWLYLNEICNIINYDVYHSCRSDRGGGVSIFVLSTLKHRKIFEMVDDINNFLIIELVDHNMKIFGVYNPGRNVPDFIQKFEDTLSKYCRMIVLGDMNINLLDDSNSIVTDYKCRISAQGFEILNKLSCNYATRISNTVSTIIDHVITDISNQKMSLIINETENHISDHKTIICSIENKVVNKQKVISKCIVNYENFMNDDFKSQLELVTSCEEFESLCNNKINSNKHIYHISETKKPLQPYISRELFEDIKKKNKLFKQLKADSNNATLKSQYIRLRNTVRNKTKNAKIKYYDSKFDRCVGDPKKLWSVINEVVFNKMSCSQSKEITLVENGVKIKSPYRIAQIFNDYFLSIGSANVPQTNLPSIQNRDYNNEFDFTQVEERDVEQTIIKLNRTAAVGKDGLSVKFLYRTRNFVTATLTHLVNQMLRINDFPNPLKIAKVIPLFKSGDCTSKTCFRPISILPATSKVFESIIEQQMKLYLLENNIINVNQYGFLQKSNTVAASADLMNTIYSAKDKGLKVTCVFLDFSKAFDCISHSILLQKIRMYGFTESALKLLETYLDQRPQYTFVNNCYSASGYIKSGVPQGSILGPLLFLIFVNDIWKLPLKGRLQLYADDACLVYEANTFEELETNMQYDLNILLQWLTANRLKLNFEKSCYMVVNSTASVDVRLDSISLKKVDCMNFLGLVLDSNLSWKIHIDHVIRKITPYVFAIRKARPFIREDTCWKLYNSFILPHLTYMSCLWGCAAEIYLKPLKVLQNRVIKTIRNLPLRFPSIELYDEKILPVQLLCKYNMLLHIHKIRHNLIKTNVTLVYVSTVHSHNTRQQDLLYVSGPRTTNASKNLFYQGIIMYNALPSEMKNLNVKLFKRRLRNQLYN